MKIAFFNCQMRSIPPEKSGGTEKIINYLVKGVAKHGHQLTVFSTGDSKLPKGVELVSLYPNHIEMLPIPAKEKGVLNDQRTKRVGEILIARQDEFDLICNFCLGSSLSIVAKLRTPHISRICEELNPQARKRLSSFKNNYYISQSFTQRKGFPELNYVKNVFNGTDTLKIPFSLKPDNYLLFVGRISKQKSPHLAILAAKALNMKLIILGKYKDEDIEGEYYKKTFMPIFKENKDLVEWRGEVDSETVNKYFSKAKASLFPVSFEEPFSNAGIESMAAGCPVIAFRKGAYQECVINGKTGYLVDDLEGMIEAVKKVDKIDRGYCREHVKKNFSVEKMVLGYIKAFEKVAKKKKSSRLYRSKLNEPQIASVY